MRWRSELKKKPKRLIIKLGSLCVSRAQGGLSVKKISSICEQVSGIQKLGIEIILVSSGAISTARKTMTQKGTSIADLQSLSSIGQPILMGEYVKQFSKHQTSIAQLLVTHDDIKHSTRRFNLKNTIEKLLSWGCIPIVNENDSVSFDEISLGDNDQLAAMLAETCSADLLVILSQTQGLYDRDPKHKDAKIISSISFDDDFSQIETIDKNSLGRGGMRTKLDAVRRLTPLGTPVVIGSPESLRQCLEGRGGSFFSAADTKLKSKKARILNQAKAGCYVGIDLGAKQAVSGNKSLLPMGIIKVEGRFNRGDVVAIRHKNTSIGYGVAEFSSTQLRSYLSKNKPLNFQELLTIPGKTFIHKNNLVLKR